MAVEFWRYALLPSKEPRDSWSIIFLDSEWVMSVVSDHGNWAYRWPKQDNFKAFLCQCDGNYVARKLGGSTCWVFDPDRTSQEARKWICSERRRRDMDKEAAREEYDRALNIGDGYTWTHFLDETEIPDAWEFGCRSLEPGLKHWTEVSFPRLQELLRKEL